MKNKQKITNLAVPSDEAVKISLPSKDQAISYKIPKCPESSPCSAPDGIWEDKRFTEDSTNLECAKTYTDYNFPIIGQARSSFHLSALESVYIKTQNPVLCRQKEFVFSLGLFK